MMGVVKDDFTGDIIRDVSAKLAGFVIKGGAMIEAEMKTRTPVDTGQLRKSLSSQFDSDADGPYTDTGPGTEYAEHVELGTSRMEAQPYAEPGFQAARPKIDRLAEQELKV